MRREKGRRATVCCAVAVILMCYLVQAIDCYRLTKTERRGWREEADALGAQKGKVVFGISDGKGSGLESEGKYGKASANSSVEESYQADFIGWSKGQTYDATSREAAMGQTYDATSREAAWRRMAPFLLCGGDRMKFRVVGRGVSQLAVDQANAPPVPLSQVPPSCGYNMQRNLLSLVMMVPYDGCSVVQEGGSYVLPMRWQGIPVSLWCSKPAAPAPMTTASQTPQDPASNSQMPYASKNPDQLYAHVPQPFFFPQQMHYPYPSVAVSDPAATIKQPEMPPFQQYPLPFPPRYPYFYPPLPATTAARMATTTTTAKPEIFIPPELLLPGYKPVGPPFLWPFQLPVPAGTQTTTNGDSYPQSLQVPPNMHYFPQFVPLPQYLNNPNADLAAPTGSSDTVLHQYVPPFPQFVPQYPSNPNPDLETGSTDTLLPQAQSHNFPHFHQQVQLMPNPSLSS
ncbi:vegetative cell wall protein gp1-like [Oreochromis aureus]|uniref:vegetative cell wall protein gp1-like n=1 Tax=Oreochromis aureus TaxID=47969 RepID=UPI001954B0A7|nr:vegetative cell wall protein gp1-like [Oreochromis aureus]